MSIWRGRYTHGYTQHWLAMPISGTTATRISDVIAHLGQSKFGKFLDCLLRSECSFDMSCIFSFSKRSKPIPIHDGYSSTVSRNAIVSYVDGSYLLDPFYVASVGEHQPGLWRMSELAPDSFYSSDFFLSPEVHPCISNHEGSLVEEVGYVIPLGSGVTATYSLMRLAGHPAFSGEEVARLRDISPLVFSLIRAHWGAVRHDEEGPNSDRDMESAFQLAFGGRLTPTQHKIAKLILRGHSAASIAATLGIAEGTAKLHRVNIYRRLEITSQSELFKIFTDHLLKGGIAGTNERPDLELKPSKGQGRLDSTSSQK